MSYFSNTSCKNVKINSYRKNIVADDFKKSAVRKQKCLKLYEIQVKSTEILFLEC
jgi:hypothetical protein